MSVKGDNIFRYWRRDAHRLTAAGRAFGTKPFSWQTVLAACVPAWLLSVSSVARALAGIRVSKMGDRFWLRFPDGRTLVHPVPRTSRPDWTALREAILAHWLQVVVLDEYDARRFLRPGSCIVDVGANTGTFTIFAAAYIGPEGRIASIEPVPENVECLRLTVEANELGHVQIVPVAAGAIDGEARMFLSPTRSGAHSLAIERSDETIVVPVRRLDAIVAQLGLERVDLVKIDVEGYEQPVLEGAIETIREHEPVIIASAHRNTVDEHIVEPLLAAGADYRVTCGRVHRRLDMMYWCVPARMGEVATRGRRVWPK